jgi:cell division GTPase FtsZ
MTTPAPPAKVLDHSSRSFSGEQTMSFLRRRKPSSTVLIGVGLGGIKIVDYLLEEGFDYWKAGVIDTDRQTLADSCAQHKLLIGEQTVGGIGTNGDPAKGRQAMTESVDQLQDILANAQQLIVTTCLGGGVGSGATPVIGQLAQKNHLKSMAVVGLPFGFEGTIRLERSRKTLETLPDLFNPLYVLWAHNFLPLLVFDRSNQTITRLMDLNRKMLAQNIISHFSRIDISNLDENFNRILSD